MSTQRFSFSQASRRDLLRAAMYGVTATAGGVLPIPVFGQAAAQLTSAGKTDGKILVVLELSGGNDGLNTLVPYGDDAYYKLRPNIGIPKKEVRAIDNHFGFSGGMAGFERLYKDGQLAVIHGCGYENPSFSHFTSMAYWHTGAPNSGEEYGWVGRLADAMAPDAPANYLVNIGARQSLAVRSRKHVPVVFDDPNKFTQEKFYEEREVLGADSSEVSSSDPSSQNASSSNAAGNAARRFLLDTARSAKDASGLVQQAWAKYRSPVDYGIVSLDLPKVAALIDAGMPTRLYYTSYRNNSFDTHVFQSDTHKRLLTYVSDAVAAFLKDLERIGRADDVTVMIFSEFGRRVPENVNLGTDHGAANLMFVAGKQVRGGQYGTAPSLTKLDPGDNLLYTTDFRRVYSTMISGWLGLHDTSKLLNGKFEPFDIFHGKA